MAAPPRRLLEYAIAILAVFVALVLRWLADPLVGSRIPFATILGAVAVAVGVGGLYPALLATALGYVASDILFMDPRGLLQLSTPGDWITLAGYLFACFAIILFGILMRRAQRSHQEAAAALRELNQRKDAHLATVAHELRNPLAPIRAAMEVLKSQDTISGRDVRTASDMIDRQLEHLTRLIDDLVDIDRIARNQLEFRKDRVSLVTIAEHALEVMRSPMTAQDHDVRVTLPKQPLFVDGDAHRIEQVLINLLGNANKFTPAGKRIELVLEAESAQAIIRVKDTGAGIPPEAMPRIFELFFQADRTQRGLGIGLALVRQLVEMHDGSVTAYSAGPGRGSEFVVTLPLCADQTSSVEQRVASETSPIVESQTATVS